jgi:hypothetical protein
VPGDLPDELFEVFVGSSPFFDFRDEIDGHVDGAGLGFLFEGEVPTGGSAAGTLEGAEGSLDKGAGLSQAPEGGEAAGGVAVVGEGACFHIGSIKAYCMWQAKRRVRRRKIRPKRREAVKRALTLANH